MNWQSFHGTLIAWRFVSAGALARGFFAALGLLWLLTEILSYFSSEIEKFLRSQGILFGLLAIAWALYSSRPKSSFEYQLSGRDVLIEIRIGNAFDMPGALVVPTNTSFENSLGGKIPKAASVQGGFIRAYCDGGIEHLNNDIEKNLARSRYEWRESADGGSGNRKQYEAGTVVHLRRQERLFYLLALTHINAHGLAVPTEKGIDEILARLWYYISEKGETGEIVIPVIGTGHGRIAEQREEVIKSIVRSFIASCTDTAYCKKLTVAVLPSDVSKYDIDVPVLAKFLENACRFVDFDRGGGNAIGTGLR